MHSVQEALREAQFMADPPPYTLSPDLREKANHSNRAKKLRTTGNVCLLSGREPGSLSAFAIDSGY